MLRPDLFNVIRFIHGATTFVETPPTHHLQQQLDAFAEEGFARSARGACSDTDLSGKGKSHGA